MIRQTSRKYASAWEQRKLGELFDYEQPQPYIVRGTEYDDSFPTPVLTAGQSFVLGYTNEKQGIKMASPEHPVIIFDDFTTSSHFVDFPFKVKSSAIKLLTLRDKNEDIHFAYQVLQNIAYTPVSHERHWISKFATFATLMPECKSEMQAIGHFMSNLDGLITLHQRKYDKLVIFKKSMLEKMFPKDGESVPEIRFAGFTDPWEQRKLGELVVIERGGSPRPIDEYITDDTNGLNWVKIGDAPSLGRYISKTSEKIKPEGLSKTRQVHPGDLILSNSMSFGRPYIMAIEGCIHDGWLLIRDEPKSFDPMYLCHMLGTPKMLNQYRMLASGSTVNNLNKELVSNASILMPCKSEQKVIGQFFNHLDDLITLHQRKLELLQNIKKSLLDKMFV